MRAWHARVVPFLAAAVLLAADSLLPDPALALQESAPPDSPRQEVTQEEPLRRSERVTVTANRVEEPAELVGSSVTVVTADEIATSGAHWLTDVLARVPGVTVITNGGPGSLTGIFLRGTESNHTLVLVDGVKVNSPSTGDYDFANLPASQVERLEVLRGPQSTLYGSDAIGGVINVITRAGGGAPRFSVSAEGGAFGTSRLAASTQGAAGRLFWSLGADRFRSDGFSAADEAAGNTEPDSFRNDALDGRLGYRHAGFEAEAFVSAFDGRTFLDGFGFGVGPVDDPEQLQERRGVVAGARARLERGRYRGTVTVSSTDEELGSVDPDGFARSFDLDASIREVDFQNELRVGRGHSVLAGVEHRRERAATLSTSPFGDEGYDRSVDVTGLFAQYRLAIDERVHAAAGVRWESHSLFGDQSTYRVAIGWEALPALRLHGSIGTGFRAPTLNELFYPGFGNPGLGPEKSLGWDLGARLSVSEGRFELDLTAFGNEIDGLIEFLFPGGFQNLGEARSRGIEATATWIVAPRLRADVAYTLTETEDLATGLPLLRRPRHQGALMVEWRPVDRARLFTELRFKGPRDDFGPVDRVTLPAYALWNLAAGYDLIESLQLQGRIDNLTDADYQEIYGYGTPGLSGYLGLRYAFTGGS